MLLSNLFSKVWKIFRFFLLIGLGFVLLYPLIFMIATSFKSQLDVTDPSIIWLPRHLTWDNINLAVKAMSYWDSLKNTLVIGLTSSILQIISCALVGYGFARFKFKERGFLFAMVLFTLLVPPLTVAIPMFGMYKDFFPIPFVSVIFGEIPGTVNLLNTNTLFYLPAALGTGIRSGLYIYIFRQFFRSIPRELEEAATIDGCGPFSTFTKIMIPNAGGAFLTVFLFSVVWYWNDFFNTSLFMTGRMTLSIALASLRQNLGLHNVEFLDPFEVAARLQAGCLLLILPMLIMYAFLQRYFTESIERTGIVG